MTQSLPTALAIHTTTSNLGLCLSHPNQEVSTKTWDLGRELSSQLHHKLLEFTQTCGLNQLDFIAVATGPGGFTSTRIGVVTARTLAQQLDIPLFGISSLAALAWRWAIASFPLLEPEGEDFPAIAIQMPARREQIFAAIYSLELAPDQISDQIPGQPPGKTNLADREILKDASAMPLWQDNHSRQIKPQPFRLYPYQPEQVLTQDAWQQSLAQLPHPAKVVLAEGPLGHTAIDVLDLAWQDYRTGQKPHWSIVQPFYGQSPV